MVAVERKACSDATCQCVVLAALDWRQLTDVTAKVSLDTRSAARSLGRQVPKATFRSCSGDAGKALRPDRALRLYEQLLSAGLRPNVKTFTSLIAACQKDGRAAQAWDILRDMQQRGAAAAPPPPPRCTWHVLPTLVLASHPVSPD